MMFEIFTVVSGFPVRQKGISFQNLTKYRITAVVFRPRSTWIQCLKLKQMTLEIKAIKSEARAFHGVC